MQRVFLPGFSLLLSSLLATSVTAGDPHVPNYQELRREFLTPDHAHWGEVPLWWWEGNRMTRERVSWQLETLAAKGVKSVCPIQRSPGRCDPQSFSEEWWDLFAFANQECQRLGMTLWAYDQVGYGHYGWLEKAAARVQDADTAKISFHTAEGNAQAPIRLELPEGLLLGARAFPVDGEVGRDDQSVDLRGSVNGQLLEWTPAAGSWRVAASVAVPSPSFYLSEASADAFVDMFYGKIERTLGKTSMGTSFVGIFQDEHPPTPRDIYTEELAKTFRQRFGYEIARAIPAAHFDIGPLTPKYRNDFFDAYLAVVEPTYWKRIYDWTRERSLLTSHDNWGRNDINRQSQGYIDYFRTQRWFSAPGYDDAGQRPLNKRNYYDAKIASSIARLYGRSRVWNEAFHSSGWGRTTDQTLTWLSTGNAFGANQYDEHGLYYATCSSTWEHAAPDPHWRQPYWKYYQTLSDWVARTSHLMSQGRHVVDVAVHYPVVSLLAGEPPGTAGPDYNHYMALSKVIFDDCIDNDIFDDDSILGGSIEEGRLVMGGNGYQALVFGPETTVRRAVLEKALQLVESGGTVLFFERLPSATTEGGREDLHLGRLFEKLLGISLGEKTPKETVSKKLASGGFCAFVPANRKQLPALISAHIARDFVSAEGNVYVTHREVGDTHVYLLQNTAEDGLDLKARFRVDGVPEWWEPFTGKVLEVDRFERHGEYTTVEHRLEGNTAWLLVFRNGTERSRNRPPSGPLPAPKALSNDWTFSVMATRNNRWGEFRWPPSDELIGPEVRTFRYREEADGEGVPANWHLPGFDDHDWDRRLYSTGPYWLFLSPDLQDKQIVRSVLSTVAAVQSGGQVATSEKALTWREVRFSKTIGLAKAAPWGGHSGYPDGHIDKNFVQLPEGRKLLFTRLLSGRAVRLGLRVELRNSTPRLWVNGEEQPFEDAVGNLPLREGVNSVLLDLSDGGHGRLFVQATPPSVSSLRQAATGSVVPELGAASWIWSGDGGACYVRKTFELEQVPQDAQLVVSAFSGYRLFVNGVKIEEEIGPWANWQKPEIFTVTPYLNAGTNVIAVWGQLYSGQHVNKGSPAYQSKAVVLAFKAREPDGKEISVVTDGSWKGTTDDVDGWEEPTFDDSTWPAVTIRGRMGDPPWGKELTRNVRGPTEPRRPLSIDLASPYLECFAEVPDLVYDVKPEGARRVGWYRFSAPPGLRGLTLPTRADAQVWVDGEPAKVRDGNAHVASPPPGVSKVAIRLEMEPGSYAGAAFPKPIGLTIGGGTIEPGPWSDFALPTYSGIGVYRQKVEFTANELEYQTFLDLGQVLVAAEVLVNGKSAGVGLARPFRFELTDLLQEGENSIEIHVANTIAPHYTTIPALHVGPTSSGLLGPVRLYFREDE